MYSFLEHILNVFEKAGFEDPAFALLASLIGILVIIILVVCWICFLIEKHIYNKNRKELYAYLEEMQYFTLMKRQFDLAFGSSDLFRALEKSSQMVSNFASHKKIDYLVKYFGFTINDESIKSLKYIYDIQKKAEDYIEDNSIKKSILFNDVTPCFCMVYTSPSGRNTRTSNFEFNCNEIAGLYNYTKKLLLKQMSAKSQRSAMTAQMRESVLRRDNWTCQICGNSVYKEPNLLLEVDHIIPVSKGGKTEPNNLQTLCWKCNRSKSDKL